MKKLKISFLILLLLFISRSIYAADNINIDTGITAWMLTSTALVLLMIPGLAMFYGGLVRTKNVIGTMMQSFAAMGIVTVLWAVIGYSMAFGKNVLGGWFGWNKDYFLLQGIDTSILEKGIPEYVFTMFQGKFAILTPALIAGALAERIRFKAYLLFITLWSILVYNPLCHWVWASDGFLYKMGAIDFAGGTVVHISSGVSGLIIALYLGKRIGYPRNTDLPNNLVMTLIGAGLLWVGWFGFNAGSSIDAGLDTAQALTVTQIAAGTGALTWMLIELFKYGKSTALGFASGILAGLVAITPAAGVVKPIGAIAIGIIAAILCFYAIQLKNRFKYDDSLDAFGIHGIGGITGSIVLAFFMRNVNSFSEILHQLKIQAIAVGIAILYAIVITLIILLILDKISPLRSSEKEEKEGLDTSYHGEHGYGMLYLN